MRGNNKGLTEIGIIAAIQLERRYLPQSIWQRTQEPFQEVFFLYLGGRILFVSLGTAAVPFVWKGLSTREAAFLSSDEAHVVGRFPPNDRKQYCPESFAAGQVGELSFFQSQAEGTKGTLNEIFGNVPVAYTSVDEPHQAIEITFSCIEVPGKALCGQAISGAGTLQKKSQGSRQGVCRRLF